MREMRALAASLVLLSTTVFAVGLPGHPVGHIIGRIQLVNATPKN